MTSTEELRKLLKDHEEYITDDPTSFNVDYLVSFIERYSDARVKEAQLEIRKFLLDHVVSDTDEARFIEIKLTTPAPTTEEKK